MWMKIMRDTLINSCGAQNFFVKYGKLVISVNSNLHYDLYDFAFRYFEPWLQVDKSVREDSCIALNIKPLHECSIVDEDVGSDCFVWLKKTNDPDWRISAKKKNIDDETIFFINEREAVVGISPDNLSVTLYVNSDSLYLGVSVLEELFIHIIIGFVIKFSEANGNLLLHAASIKTKGFSALIVGEGGSGKTTTLLTAMLIDKTAECISNDRCFLSFDGKKFYAHGIPSTVNIRYESINSFPEFKTKIEHVDEAARSRHKILLPHKDIVVNNIQKGAIDCIIFPKCNLPNLTHCKKISPDEAIKRLADQCESYINTDKYPHWHPFFKLPKIYNDKYVQEMLTNLCASVSSYELEWGSDFREAYKELPINIVLGSDYK